MVILLCKKIILWYTTRVNLLLSTHLPDLQSKIRWKWWNERNDIVQHYLPRPVVVKWYTFIWVYYNYLPVQMLCSRNYFIYQNNLETNFWLPTLLLLVALKQNGTELLGHTSLFNQNNCKIKPYKWLWTILSLVPRKTNHPHTHAY